jgi:ribonuclease BN (tRNA processing enzyme)
MKLLFAIAVLLSAIGAAQSKTDVILLGTGAPPPNPARSGPSLAIQVNEHSYLVDSGPGVVRRAAQAWKQGNKGLAMPKLTHVFITHLHSDHTLGLPDLMFTPWVTGRSEPLHVFGPPGTEHMVHALQDAYRDDVANRTEGKQPHEQGWTAMPKDAQPGVIYQDANVKVTAFKVPHTGWKSAYGYKFETKDRTVVVSGDCTPNEEIVRQCNGCDVLVHEVYSVKAFAIQPPEWQRYHAQSHTSTKELAEIAKRARPRLLVLTHVMAWDGDYDQLVKEIKAAGYDGEVKLGEDLGVY